MMIRTPTMLVMMEAVTKASRSLKRDFNEVENLLVSLKGPGDFVSKADKAAEKALFAALSKARPDYGFVMEEAGIVEGKDKAHRFHIDPLDGTRNFLHGIPHCAISVALEREGQVIAGIVYDFIKDEWFIAEKGQGAFVNNRRLRVSARRVHADALIGTGIPHIGKPGHAQFQRELAAVMGRFSNVCRFGSAALDLAYVAAGRLDAWWERGLNSWDMAAGVILVREAGGFLSTPEGKDWDLAKTDIAAGNEHIHAELIATLRAA